MSLSRLSIAALAIGSLVALPLGAQTTTTTTTSHGHAEVKKSEVKKTEAHAAKATEEKHETKAEEKAEAAAKAKQETKAEEKHEMKMEKGEMKAMHPKMHSTTSRAAMPHQRVWSDATRLGAILTDVQSNANVGPSTWKTVANEANTLANRIYAGTGSSKTARADARNLRMHVREMRAAALKGDAASAKMHASEAVPFNAKVIEWSRPM